MASWMFCISVSRSWAMAVMATFIMVVSSVRINIARQTTRRTPYFFIGWHPLSELSYSPSQAGAYQSSIRVTARLPCTGR